MGFWLALLDIWLDFLRTLHLDQNRPVLRGFSDVFDRVDKKVSFWNFRDLIVFHGIRLVNVFGK